MTHPRAALGRSLAVLALAALAAAGGRLGAADEFIRGDTNNDGALTISDAHVVLAFFEQGFPPPSCMDAADYDDTGSVDGGAFAGAVMEFLFGLYGRQPAWPYPEPGEDVFSDTAFEDDCVAYGGGSPLVDPQAKLRVLDATAPGGGDTRAVITLAFSSSRPIAALSGRFRSAANIVRAAGGTVENLHEPTVRGLAPDERHRKARLRNGSVEFGLINSPRPVTQDEEPRGWGPIPAGQDAAIVEVAICLRAGTLAGEYPLALEAGELTDWESARAVHPALVGGTLTVLADVSLRSGCRADTPPPPPPSNPANATFRIGDGEGAPGSPVELPFFIRAESGAQGYSFSVDFDEEVLQVSRIEQVWEKPDGSDYDFKVYEFNNENATHGSEGVDEGFLLGAAVFDQQEPVAMPPDTDNLALRFHFTIDPGTSAGTTTVIFLDGGQGSGQPVANVLTADGMSHSPILDDSFILIGARVNILADISTFIRGDSNSDHKLDVSDAQHALSYLFLGGDRPRCFDAVDSNDDGHLDLADPVALLGFLFLSGGPPPAPYPAPGTDPSADAMTCLSLGA